MKPKERADSQECREMMVVARLSRGDIPVGMCTGVAAFPSASVRSDDLCKCLEFNRSQPQTNN